MFEHFTAVFFSDIEILAASINLKMCQKVCQAFSFTSLSLQSSFKK